VLIKLGDKVSTDDISPSGTQVLMFRSNVPAIAEFCFGNVDPEFVARARGAGQGLIVGGEIYGQGSSREAAVLSPLHLGVRAVLAKSFARIHRANLINFGILPLTFVQASDYDVVAQGDKLEIPDLKQVIKVDHPFPVKDLTNGKSIQVVHGLTERQKEIILAGGLLNWTKQKTAEAPAAKPAAGPKAAKGSKKEKVK